LTIGFVVALQREAKHEKKTVGSIEVLAISADNPLKRVS
jgi:hypothetical protein